MHDAHHKQQARLLILLQYNTHGGRPSLQFNTSCSAAIHLLITLPTCPPSFYPRSRSAPHAAGLKSPRPRSSKTRCLPPFSILGQGHRRQSSDSRGRTPSVTGTRVPRLAQPSNSPPEPRGRSISVAPGPCLAAVSDGPATCEGLTAFRHRPLLACVQPVVLWARSHHGEHTDRRTAAATCVAQR
ncbi:hypothetical protein C8Q76DRAFT_758398 [Earliella scabrosa]|nr:hypothetical protein C8Q76DRAFT_758398 [Earliella scabrosa]